MLSLLTLVGLDLSHNPLVDVTFTACGFEAVGVVVGAVTVTGALLGIGVALGDGVELGVGVSLGVALGDGLGVVMATGEFLLGFFKEFAPIT